MTQKHTPTPWTFKQDPKTGDCGITAVGVGILAETYAEIRRAHEYATGESHANAAHIVKCVNMHDELVEALEIAETYRMTKEDRIIIEEALKKAGAL